MVTLQKSYLFVKNMLIAVIFFYLVHVLCNRCCWETSTEVLFADIIFSHHIYIKYNDDDDDDDDSDT